MKILNFESVDDILKLDYSKQKKKRGGGGKFLKKLRFCVGGEVKQKFGFVDKVPKRNSTADVSSVSPSSELISDEGLTLDTSASEWHSKEASVRFIMLYTVIQSLEPV